MTDNRNEHSPGSPGTPGLSSATPSDPTRNVDTSDPVVTDRRPRGILGGRQCGRADAARMVVNFDWADTTVAGAATERVVWTAITAELNSGYASHRTLGWTQSCGGRERHPVAGDVRFSSSWPFTVRVTW